MKSKQRPFGSKNLRDLSISIGDFIRYWGFRRIHGAIWTQVFLSKTPLSCKDLTKNLRLSKALISPALDELTKFGLLECVSSSHEKVKLFRAKDEINEVILGVLRKREKKILQKISKDFNRVHENLSQEEVDLVRLKELEQMIFSAGVVLDVLLEQDDLLNLVSVLKI